MRGLPIPEAEFKQLNNWYDKAKRLYKNSTKGKHPSNCLCANCTVSIIKLIKFHTPTNNRELYDLLIRHQNRKCDDCGCIAKFKPSKHYDICLKEWANRLSNVAEKNTVEWAGYCYDFIVQIFITESIGGKRKEDICKEYIEKTFPEYLCQETTEIEDKKYHIDLKVFNRKGELVGGIQCKSTSYIYKNTPELIDEKTEHTDSHKVWGSKYLVAVIYMYFENGGIARMGAFNLHFTRMLYCKGNIAEWEWH